MKVIVTLSLFLMVLPVLATDIAKDPSDYVEGIVQNHEEIMSRGTAAVVVINDGVFTDLSAYYATCLGNCGFAADIYYDPAGGVDYSAYDIVVATCADNWWDSVNYPMEINAWSSYIDGGGKVFLIGQDFLVDSANYSFATDYCGMADFTRDVLCGDFAEMTWIGTADGPLDDISHSMFDCFPNND